MKRFLLDHFKILMVSAMTASTLLMTFFLIGIAIIGEVRIQEPNQLILFSELILMLFASVFSVIHLFKYGIGLGRKA